MNFKQLRYHHNELVALLEKELIENKRLTRIDYALRNVLLDNEENLEEALGMLAALQRTYKYENFSKYKSYLIDMLMNDVPREIIDDWLTKEDLASAPYNMSLSTQAKKRTAKHNPMPYYQPQGIGVIYRKSEIDAWMLQGKVI